MRHDDHRDIKDLKVVLQPGDGLVGVEVAGSHARNRQQVLGSIYLSIYLGAPCNIAQETLGQK